MTVLSTVREACTVLGLDIPTVLFSSTTRTSVEISSMANFCARQIADEYDWSRLKKVTSFTGDGVLTAFPFADDYDRMVKNANLWGPNFTFYPSMQVSDTNIWLELQTYQMEPWEPRWSVFGGNINVLPVLADGDTLSYAYVSKWIVSGNQEEFTADTDTFLLDSTLLRLCFIYNWKKAKGMDYAAELQEYEDDLGRKTYRDTGSRQNISSGRWRRFPTGQSFP